MDGNTWIRRYKSERDEMDIHDYNIQLSVEQRRRREFRHRLARIREKKRLHNQLREIWDDDRR